MKYNVPLKRSGEAGWRSIDLVRGGARALVILVSGVVIGGVSLSVWQIDRSKSLASVGMSKGEDSSATSSDDVLMALGRHMIVPRESTPPQVSLIKDPAALEREQSFYRGAARGDALIVFPESREAVIFSMKRDRIVNMGPVRFKTIRSASSSAPDESATDASAQKKNELQ